MTAQAPPSNSDERKKSPALAFSLAFLPSVMLLGLISCFGKFNQPAILLYGGCLVSVVCCFASATLLFRRKTGLALFAGALFLILNTVISFLFGSGAVLSNMNFK